MQHHHLALITSPLQLINLRQLCEDRHLDKTEITLVIKFSKKRISAKALQQEIALDQSWGDVIIFENKSKFLYLKNLIKKLRPINWKTVISGELTSWWQNILLANLHFEERILVDDGTMTLFDYQTYMKKGSCYQKSKFVKKVLLNTLNVKTRITNPWPITLFSLFPLTNNKYVRCEKNSLSILKNTLENSYEAIESTLYKKRIFLGQPFPDNGEISGDEYFGVVSHYAFQRKEECFYLPHRSESSMMTDKLKKIDNLTIMPYTLPVEKIVGQQAACYSQIAGINSTALFTLHVLYPEIPIYFYSISEFSSASRSLRQRSLVVEAFLEKQENTYQLSPRRIPSTAAANC